MDAAIKTISQRTTPLTVYLVDGDELVRRGIRNLLERTGIEVVGECSGARDALAQIARLRPEVVILDHHLPDGGGIRLCRDIHLIDRDIRCLVLTEREDDRALLESIESGASGYLPKGISSADMIAAVRRVALGHSLFGAELRQRAREQVRAVVAPDPRVAALSTQELRVLALLADGLTNRQIAQQMYLAEKTVRNYVSILLSKLGFERRTQAAVFASRRALLEHERTG